MFDYVFITHLPSFYKINLYNEIAKHKQIYVIFVAETSTIRTADFTNATMDFPYTILSNGAFEKRKKMQSLYRLWSVMRGLVYRQVVVGGWDLIEYWILVCLGTKKNMALALESGIESSSKGIRRVAKKVFLFRVSQVFASGSQQVCLLTQLGFSGRVVVTHGVGIMNKNMNTIQERPVYRRQYLYIGRLAEEKNVSMLIDVFNALPEYSLTIVGSGPLETYLQSNASTNITFCGHVENKFLPKIFEQSDFLILPSIREPWGLVVEEALYVGIPVLVSQYCGVADIVKEGKNGYTFDSQNPAALQYLLTQITSESYAACLSYIQNSDSINLKDAKQIEAYL